MPVVFEGGGGAGAGGAGVEQDGDHIWAGQLGVQQDEHQQGRRDPEDALPPQQYLFIVLKINGVISIITSDL